MNFDNDKRIKTYRALVEAAAAVGWDLLIEPSNPRQIDYQNIVFSTECSDTCFKITVNDCLPRVRTEQHTYYYWTKIIQTALDQCPLRFNKLLVIFEIHAPGQWDPDNRAIKAPIDAIRYAKLVSDDSNQYLTYMVTGQTVKSDPKTIIYLKEAPTIDNILEL